MATSPETARALPQFETPEQRQARWGAAALAAGREVDCNALRAYMAVADVEQLKLADHWTRTVQAFDAEVRRLRARVAELERPAVEAGRAEVRQSLMELSRQAREDRDFEGAFDVDCRLREREEQWSREDTPAP